jgi:hypothetical protein
MRLLLTNSSIGCRITIRSLPSKPCDGHLPHPCAQYIHDLINHFFHRYATTVINSIFPNDQAVASDPNIEAFYEDLNTSLGDTASGGLPNGPYGSLQTRGHLARFLADVLFHITVMHEMHGTKTPAYSLNPSLMQVSDMMHDYTHALITLFYMRPLSPCHRSRWLGTCRRQRVRITTLC